MRFRVLAQGESPGPKRRPRTAYLVRAPWDDWFIFDTQFVLMWVAADSSIAEIGTVKIAQFGMGRQRSPQMPDTFESLEGVFSLGQDASYYQRLMKLASSTRNGILEGLGDIVFDTELYDRALEEDVTGTSLMRYVSSATVEGQFRRIIGGGKRVDGFAFEYRYPTLPRVKTDSPLLDFAVIPESFPPTNVHAIIGRNGVGKTYLLENMAKCLVPELDGAEDTATGHVRIRSGSLAFAGVTSVTFSAFDSFEPLSQARNRGTSLDYNYVGLKTLRRGDNNQHAPKAPGQLAKEFSTSVKACAQDERLSRWRAALKTLASDPIFNNAGADDLARETNFDELVSQAQELFRRLSSGHKIVLLTITRLVEVVQEKSLVLLDEPEAHLHPPLLSAFVRALSDLLKDQNGVALLTTHSPVVLQEVPRSCVWILSRQGRIVTAVRPETETFGENVGVLTHEVFGLEVTQSGFHNMLAREAEEQTSFSALLQRFGGQLGSEASAIARALMFTRRRSG